MTARVNWRAWHLVDDHTKNSLARIIALAAREYGVRLWAFVLMSNHLHLVAQSPPAPLYGRLTGRRTKCRHYRAWPRGHPNSTVIARFMRVVRHRVSVQRHRELGLSGRFWEAPYDARRIRSALSLAARIAYDHRNPVKQGMAPSAEAYAWSSAREWVTGDPGPIPLTLPAVPPFGVELQELRRLVLSYQSTARLDDRGDELKALFASASADDGALRRLLLDCGMDAAIRCPKCPSGSHLWTEPSAGGRAGIKSPIIHR